MGTSTMLIPPYIAAGCLLGAIVALWVGRKDGPMWRGVVAGIIVVACAVAGAKLHFLIQAGLSPVSFGWRSLSAGFRLPGALLGAALGAVVAGTTVLRDLGVRRVGDYAILAVMVAIPIVRLGCLLDGCCFGTASGVPWAISFSRDSPAWRHQLARGDIGPFATSSLPVHPLQVYFAAYAAALALVALLFVRRCRVAGLGLLTVLALHELGKALLESLRDPVAPGESTLWVTSLFVGAMSAGAAALVIVRGLAKGLPANRQR